MPTVREILTPDYIGEARIALTLSLETPSPSEGLPVLIDVDYSKAEPEGLSLPLVYTVTGPSGRQLVARTFTRMPPRSLEWTAEEGGPHLVRLGELFHNHWFGVLVVDVVGDSQEIS